MLLPLTHPPISRKEKKIGCSRQHILINNSNWDLVSFLHYIHILITISLVPQLAWTKDWISWPTCADLLEEIARFLSNTSVVSLKILFTIVTRNPRQAVTTWVTSRDTLFLSSGQFGWLGGVMFSLASHKNEEKRFTTGTVTESPLTAGQFWTVR